MGEGLSRSFYCFSIIFYYNDMFISSFCLALGRQLAGRRLPARILHGARRRGDRPGRPLFASPFCFAFTRVQPLTCGAGCGICNYGEAWQLRAAKRLRGGRLLFPLRRKK
jgi:hypothetical protein